MKSAVETRLAVLAAAGETITYGALAREFGLRMAELTAQLEILMEADAAQGRPFRAAVLCQRLSPNHMPAPGFFQKAADLGADVSDPDSLVAKHRARLADKGPCSA